MKHNKRPSAQQEKDKTRCRKYGRAVRKARTTLGMSGHLLAEKLGKSRAQIGNIESGASWTDLPTAWRIYELLGVGVPPIKE